MTMLLKLRRKVNLCFIINLMKLVYHNLGGALCPTTMGHQPLWAEEDEVYYTSPHGPPEVRKSDHQRASFYLVK